MTAPADWAVSSEGYLIISPLLFGNVKYKFVKSTFPINQPNGGIMMSFTIESTIFPKAAPIIIPTAMSMTFPLTAKVFNSSNVFFIKFAINFSFF